MERFRPWVSSKPDNVNQNTEILEKAYSEGMINSSHNDYFVT